MQSAIQLPQYAWRQLNYAWVVFYIVLGALNLFVAFTMDEETWVNFKLFGMMGLTFLFILLQGFYISKHIETESTNSD